MHSIVAVGQDVVEAEGESIVAIAEDSTELLDNAFLRQIDVTKITCLHQLR